MTHERQTRAGGSSLTELKEQCGRSFDRVAGLTKPHDSEWLSLDMGMGQLKAVVVLVKHRQLTVGGLARALDISEPAASLLVDKLVTRGLVSRERRIRPTGGGPSSWPPNRETCWWSVCAAAGRNSWPDGSPSWRRTTCGRSPKALTPWRPS